MLTSTLTFLGITLGAVALLCLYIYVRQERMLFYPRQNDAELRAHWRYRRVEIPSGTHVLEGWWVDAGATVERLDPASSHLQDPESNLTVIYFGGNAEDVLHTARNAARIAARRLLVVNYRGYGGTKGKPSQAALFEDALAVYDYVLGPGGARPQDIVVMGRSLGSGVATMLAARREVRGAVLITPFDSIKAVAARHYPAMLVEMLLKHPFPSADMAPNAKVPALFLIAANDGVIAPSHAYALARVWGGDARTRSFSNVGHNDIDLHPQYYEVLNEFLIALASPTPPETRHSPL
jgi:hypothetical protein